MQTTHQPTVEELFPGLREKLPPDEYNFKHFRTKHFAFDAKATMQEWGIRPGEPAPDFELPRVEGGTLRFSDLRGTPVLLRFGSFT
jgi:hypothetical protein